ncbi:MAG: GtrA family protein [Ruminococcaceae bacterium]|nr:GtrA family protein [Oscillospiraceae bacterium]
MEKLGELFKKYRELIVYVFVGGLTTIINWVTYALLTQCFGALNLSIANTIAWAVSVIFAFFANKFWVFEHKSDEHILREFMTFLGARVLSGLIEIGGFALLVDVLLFNDWIVKIGIAVFVVIANYVLSKFLIFKK